MLLSFLAGVIAPACGFSWGGKFSIIEICTADGIESRVVENAQNGQSDLPEHNMSEQCQFCFQNAHLKSNFFGSKQAEQRIASAEQLQLNQYQTIVLNKQRNPQTLRGPPPLI